MIPHYPAIIAGVGNQILKRRLAVFISLSLAGSLLIGSLATSPAMLMIGLIALGLCMILGLLFYVLRPVPPENLPFDGNFGSFQLPKSPQQHHITPSADRPAASIVQLSVVRGNRDDV